MSPRISIMRGRALHVGDSECVRMHDTPAYKLVIGLDAPVQFRRAGQVGSAMALLVPPGVVHALCTEGRAVGLFLEAGGPLTPFVRGARDLQVPQRALQDRLRSIARQGAEHTGSDEAGWIDEAFAQLALPAGAALDARVERTLAAVARQPALSLQALAKQVHLSPERLRHLVVEQTGSSLRTLRLFQRTLLAVEHLLRGEALAKAAALAGFADQAHFTRSFVRSFGRTPSSVPARAQLWTPWAVREGDTRSPSTD
jgi:AraC-like DNA-binding protein